MPLLVTHTKAAILVESNKPLEIDIVELPKNLEYGQVLVQVIRSGVCGAQISEIKAKKGPDKFLPHLLGHEGLCEVLQIGPGVTNVQVGQIAIMHWRPGVGIQSTTPKYLWRNMTLNAGWITTFNQFSVVSENRLTPIDNSDKENNLLPLLGCAITTAYGALEKEVMLTARDNLVIFGAGGVGLSLIVVAKFFGARNIIVVDKDLAKLRIAKELGASHQIQSTNNDEIKNTLFQYLGELPDVSIDTTGAVQAMECAYECASHKGRVLTLGIPDYKATISINPLDLQFGKKLLGSHGGLSVPHTDIPHILKLIDRKLLNFDDYPFSVFQLENINSAIEQLANGEPGRMILKF